MTDKAALTRAGVARWDHSRLHATDAPQQAMCSFGITLIQAVAIIAGERGRRP